MELGCVHNAQEQAYNALNCIFDKHENEVLEIEILPKAFTPVDGSLLLVDDLCIGIPKAVLIHAFLYARAIFSRRHEQEIDHDAHAAFTRTLSSSWTKSILDATRIILLFDAEHITAANYRKQYIQKLIQDGATGVHEQPLNMATRQEMCLLDTFLTSPLNRHTKSPTLWHHRYWLHTILVSTIGTAGNNSTLEVSLTSFRRELGVVFRAGERHPRNYYAWNYARRVIHLAKTSAHSNGSGASVLGVNNIHTAAVHEWCLRHPSDTSGWSFLSHLLEHPGCAEVVRVEAVARTLDFATAFQWQGESLWMFLRTALASKKLLPSHQQSELQSKIKSLSAELMRPLVSPKAA